MRLHRKLHNNILKIHLVSIPAKPKLTQQQRVCTQQVLSGYQEH